MSSSSSEGSGVMRVRTELVLDQLVSRVLGRALELRSEIPEQAQRVLAEGLEPTELASLGYASRVTETEMFEPSRQPMPWLTAMIAERESAEGGSSALTVAVCRELAATEPDGKPDPGEGSWRVPGPGGHVRHFLALAAADEVVRGEGDGRPASARELSAGEAKRTFLFGFYVRCCEEAGSS